MPEEKQEHRNVCVRLEENDRELLKQLLRYYKVHDQKHVYLITAPQIFRVALRHYHKEIYGKKN